MLCVLENEGGLGYERDEIETAINQMQKVDWPKPNGPMPTRRLVYESFQKSIEACYFWSLNHWRYDQGMPVIEKITDTFAASEHSSFFGVQQQRLGLQQDKVSQFLATIGKMVKEMFQVVREVRIIDERLKYYEDSDSPNEHIAAPADITLKGIFIDLVEGGSKNPSSVYGMAAQLQFTTLPDLFFMIHPRTSREVGPVVEKLDFNRKVKEVLMRKLYSYVRWKEETHKEMITRRSFTIKYLRQHFASIRLYITWAKPYLKNCARLATEESKISTPDLIAAFEGSMVEIEILTKMKPKQNKKYFGVCIQTFEYRTRPSLSYQQEGYQRGPIHVGETKIAWRSYVWTQKDIDNYKAMRNHEDYELLAYVDDSVKAAMEALGEDLERYLKEAGETNIPGQAKPGEKKEAHLAKSFLEPFMAPFKIFSDIFPAKHGKKDGEEKLSYAEEEAEKKAVKAELKLPVWNHHKNFKKEFRFFTW